MNRPEPECPHCKERMVEGYRLDLADGNRRHAGEWIEGAPQRHFWFGLDYQKKQKHAVASFRCPSCGLLVDYAL